MEALCPRSPRLAVPVACALALSAVGCDVGVSILVPPPVVVDAGQLDVPDVGPPDVVDAGSPDLFDAGPADAGSPDVVDAGSPDVQPDVVDAGSPDASEGGPSDVPPTCGTGETVCGGSCVDTQTSVSNCGACGNACALAGVATHTCTAGACGVGACADGFGDCDGNAANGCEADTSTSDTHCGGCGTRCAPLTGGWRCAPAGPACAPARRAPTPSVPPASPMEGRGPSRRSRSAT